MAKYAFPKSSIMMAKQFCSWARPRMACTSLIMHGHQVLTVLTPHCISTNSSRSAEILSHGLTALTLERRVDLRNIFLHVQGDNCSKECKNNCLLRHFSFQIGLRKLHGAQLSFLSSGHSHEDVDAMFSNLRAWLARFPELWTPEAFRDCLKQFFDDPKHRPYEKLRTVLLMDKFRDWTLAHMCFCSHIFCLGISMLSVCLICDDHLTKIYHIFHQHLMILKQIGLLRKNFWGTIMEFGQVKGIGGPGAPHVFRLERLDDSGLGLIPTMFSNTKPVYHYKGLHLFS